jgi:rod shape-determining protein MreD
VYKVNRFHIYLALVLALFAHVTLLNYFKIFGAKPDLLLICVVFFGFFLGGRLGLETGIAAGFLMDMFTLDAFGVNALVLGTTGFLVGALNTKFFRESKMTQIFIVFFSSVFSMILHFIVSTLVFRSITISAGEYIGASVIPSSIYTTVVSLFVFPKFIDLYNLKDDRQLL